MRIIQLIVVVAFIAMTVSCSKKIAQPNKTKNNKQVNQEGLFGSWKHPISNRNAILDEVDGTAWLYLTAPNSMRPERDCPAFTTVPPADNVDWKAGSPPPISKDVASGGAQIEHPRLEEFSVTWSVDGQSVALRRADRIICMIVASEKRGHSRVLAKEGVLGLPFDEELAVRTFPKR